MPSEEVIRRKVKCCACGESLEKSWHINVICLMKYAKWKHPAWGNFILHVWGLASAVVCDRCVEKRADPKYAVEWNDDLSIVRYHPVEDLEDVPEKIFKPLDMLEPGRQKVAW